MAIPGTVQERAAQPVADRSTPEPERGMQGGGFPEVRGRPRGPGPGQLLVEHREVDSAARHGQQVPGVGPDQPARRIQGFPVPSTRRSRETCRWIRLTERAGGTSPTPR